MRCPKSCHSNPSPRKGWTNASSRPARARPARRGHRLLPPGNAWIIIEFGADTVAAAGSQAAALIEHYAGKPAAPSSWLITDAALCERIWSIRETAASATALAIHPGQPDPVVGWKTLRSIRCASAIICASSRRWSTATVTRHRCTATSATAASTRASPSTRVRPRASRPGAASARRGRTGRQVRRLVVRRAWRRPGQGRIPAGDVRRGTDAGLPRVQAIWDPDNRMNPAR